MPMQYDMCVKKKKMCVLYELCFHMFQSSKRINLQEGDKNYLFLNIIYQINLFIAICYLIQQVEQKKKK